MSTPANSLAAYRSYSYYHVLVMCDSTSTADALAKDTSLDVWNHASDSNRLQGTQDMGRYAPKCIGGTGKYCVLINGSTDASFVLTNAKWSTATAGHAVPGDRGTSIVVEGSITVSEPKGVAFLDQIVKCSVALGVDSSQVVYALKTFFIGHLDEVKANYIAENHITDIPPLNGIVYDVTGSFTEAGGTYEMQFVGAGHGAARLPQYSKSVNALNVKGAKTLAETFERLQANINSSYDAYYKCVVDTIQSVQGADTTKLRASLRKVKYVLDLSDVYKDTKYTVTDGPAQIKNTGKCDEPVQVTFPQNTSIESAISTIMQMSPQVKEDMAKGDTADKAKYEFKIHSAIISTPAGGTNGSGSGCSDNQAYDYTVYYRVERFPVPKNIAYNKDFQVLQSADAEEKLRNDPAYDAIKRNIIEFEYMYTGKNIDILEFDMKVNNGLAYLQTATLQNTFKGQLERVPNVQTHAATNDVNTVPVRFSDTPVQTPIFFGQNIRTPHLLNTTNAVNTIETAYTLTKHASIESADATMKITGNDQFLRVTNRTSSADFVSNTSKAAFKKDKTSTPDDQSFGDWSSNPMYAKIRIKMPRNNDDYALFTGQALGNGDEGQDYARDFWFDGYYYIYGIDHVFESGEFSQLLHMIALPKKSTFDSTQSTGTTEVQLNKSIGSCFDSNVGCGGAKTTGDFARLDRGTSSTSESSSGGGRGVVNPPFVRPNTDGSPTNLADSKTVNAQSKGLASVPLWNTASPQVKTAIVTAANNYGVDPVVLAQIISKESRFDPNAHNTKSSATGLGQFVDETWLNKIQMDPKIGVSSSLTRQQKLNARFDPQTNANATASLLADSSKSVGSTDPGDLYLSHFAGEPRAKKIIAADRAGNGSATLASVVGPKGFAAIQKANPNIVKRDDFTVGELRAFAHQKMADGAAATVPDKQGSGSVTAKASTPASSAAPPSRKANEMVAMQQNCAAQESKKDTPTCGPTAQRKG